MTIEDQISATASDYGVPPDLALAVAWQESRYNQSARGTSGEVGVFQLMPATARDLGVDPYNTSQNIDGGIRYLRQMYDQFGSWDAAVAAYNAGPGRVASGSIPSSTQSYVDKIFGLFSLSPAPGEQAMEAGPGEWAWTGSTAPGGGSSGGISVPTMLMVLLGVAVLGILVADRG